MPRLRVRSQRECTVLRFVRESSAVTTHESVAAAEHSPLLPDEAGVLARDLGGAAPPTRTRDRPYLADEAKSSTDRLTATS
jgi:hypothetical protein